jgi:hypothetical protein
VVVVAGWVTSAGLGMSAAAATEVVSGSLVDSTPASAGVVTISSAALDTVFSSLTG